MLEVVQALLQPQPAARASVLEIAQHALFQPPGVRALGGAPAVPGAGTAGRRR